jgi:cytochrome oxidase Cu insertion factor (SCO1/SenC/PrrC family)
MRRGVVLLFGLTALCLAGISAWAVLHRPAAPTAGQAGDSPATDVDYPVADFSLTERSGRTVRRDELRGKVWVAAFVFTRCAGPCPQVSGTMARMQSLLAGDDDVRLVSFTVDPKHDTPAVLRKYAERFGADPRRWLFLTGDRDGLYGLIQDSFHLGVQEAAGADRKPGSEVAHSTRLAVVDRRGHVRGYYSGSAVDEAGQPADDVPKLLQRIAELKREGP